MWGTVLKAEAGDKVSYHWNWEFHVRLERTIQRAGEAADAIAEETEELAHGLSQLKAAIDSSNFRSLESRVGTLDAPAVGQSNEPNIVQTAFPGRNSISQAKLDQTFVSSQALEQSSPYPAPQGNIEKLSKDK